MNTARVAASVLLIGLAFNPALAKSPTRSMPGERATEAGSASKCVAVSEEYFYKRGDTGFGPTLRDINAMSSSQVDLEKSIPGAAGFIRAFSPDTVSTIGVQIDSINCSELSAEKRAAGTSLSPLQSQGWGVQAKSCETLELGCIHDDPPPEWGGGTGSKVRVEICEMGQPAELTVYVWTRQANGDWKLTTYTVTYTVECSAGGLGN